MMGLLPEVAADFQISIPRPDISSPLCARRRVRRAATHRRVGQMAARNVLIGLMVVFTAGNLVAAMASSYEMLLAARV